ncbi:hypothetical protein EQG41_18385 [Billgrantia azerbaijanica]|nr:hypothetical protein EQG41_18385 [Halomonas azerbaijanica]
MKHIAILSLAAALAGCAGLPQADPPGYDPEQKALIGEGYPVERIEAPDGFIFSSRYDNRGRLAHAPADDLGSTSLVEGGVAWLSREGGTAVATAQHQGLALGSEWMPWNDSDGFEFVGDHRVQYAFETGRYREVAGDPESVPGRAPECAAASTMVLKTVDRLRRTILVYAEGMDCDQLAGLGGRDAEAQRQRAYRAFGLR